MSSVRAHDSRVLINADGCRFVFIVFIVAQQKRGALARPLPFFQFPSSA